jgi:hypothetical protein
MKKIMKLWIKIKTKYFHKRLLKKWNWQPSIRPQIYMTTISNFIPKILHQISLMNFIKKIPSHLHHTHTHTNTHALATPTPFLSVSLHHSFILHARHKKYWLNLLKTSEWRQKFGFQCRAGEKLWRCDAGWGCEMIIMSTSKRTADDTRAEMRWDDGSMMHVEIWFNKNSLFGFFFVCVSCY